MANRMLCWTYLLMGDNAKFVYLMTNKLIKCHYYG